MTMFCDYVIRAWLVEHCVVGTNKSYKLACSRRSVVHLYIPVIVTVFAVNKVYLSTVSFRLELVEKLPSIKDRGHTDRVDLDL